MRKFFLCLLALILLGCGYIFYDGYTFMTSPASSAPEDVEISIASGATFDRVAWDLKKKGVITDVFRFRLLAKAEKALGSIKAGEFIVNTGWTPERVLHQITNGQAVLYRLSIREGLTWWETARAVEEQGFATYDDFKAIIHDPEFLREHNIPFKNAEGFLYPETYMMKKPPARDKLDKKQAREVASIMVTMFWKQTAPLWQQLPHKNAKASTPMGTAGALTSPSMDAASTVASTPQVNATIAQSGAVISGIATANATAESPNLGLPDTAQPIRNTGLQSPADIAPEALKKLMILASLVEKETGIPSERARVAGVYSNRLRVNMLLQCDPTIIYGVGESFTGVIYRSQINDKKNLYNTYQHAGLPPGPICSSGRGALEAAMSPEKHDYFFFVATGIDGGHTFSKTNNEHNQAVRIYRERMRSSDR